MTEIIHYTDFKSFFKDILEDDRFPELLYLTRDRIKQQQVRNSFKNRFIPKIVFWKDFIENEALLQLKKHEKLINNQLKRFLIKDALYSVPVFKKIAHFEGSVNRFQEIFSQITLNPNIVIDDGKITRVYKKYKERKKEGNYVDNDDLLVSLSHNKKLNSKHENLVLDSFFKLSWIEWRILFNLANNIKGKVLWIGDWFKEFKVFFEENNYSQESIKILVESEYRKTVTRSYLNNPEVFVLPDRVKEVEAVAARLKKWIIEKEEEEAKVDLGKVMVFFYDSDLYLPIIKRVFQNYEIPYKDQDNSRIGKFPAWSFLKKLIEIKGNEISFEDLDLINSSGFFPDTISSNEIERKKIEIIFEKLNKILEEENFNLPDEDFLNVRLDTIIKIAEETGLTDFDLVDSEVTILNPLIKYQINQIKNADYERHKHAHKQNLKKFIVDYFILKASLKKFLPYIKSKKPIEKINELIKIVNEVLILDQKCEKTEVFKDILTSTLFQLKNNLPVTRAGSFDPVIIIGELEEALLKVRVPTSSPYNSVIISDTLASTGLEIDRLYIGGFVEGEFPPALERNYKWDLIKKIEPLDEITESYNFLSHYIKQEIHIEFFYPSADDEGRLAKSPFLIDGGFYCIKGDELEAKLNPEGNYLLNQDSLYSEVGNGIISRGQEGCVSSLNILREFKENSDSLKGVIDMQAKRRDFEFSEYEGIIGDSFSPMLNRSFSVSTLENLAECPMKFHFKENLGLDKKMYPEPVAKATTIGSLLHRILERFFMERDCRTVTERDLNSAENQIKTIANEEFNNFSLSGKSVYQTYERDRILSILMEWLVLELKHAILFSPAKDIKGAVGIELKYPLADDVYELGGFKLTGKIDRVDFHNYKNEFVIIDYKRTRAPEMKRLEKKLNLQLPTYTRFIQEKTGRKLSMAGYISFNKKPLYSIQLRSISINELQYENSEDLFDYNLMNKRDPAFNTQGKKAKVLYTSLIEDNGIEDIYKEMMESYKTGSFHYTFKEQDFACKYCDYQRICRYDKEKADLIKSNRICKPETPKRYFEVEIPPIFDSEEKEKIKIPAQEMALDLNRNIVVTAGAGSGKTSILVDRAIKIFDKKVDIEKVLVITFTKNAAREMRNRIYKKLHEILKSENRFEGIEKAYMNFVDNYISTIDAFCLSILREFAAEACVNPQLSITHDFTIKKLQKETVFKYFDSLSQNGDWRLKVLLKKWTQNRLKKLFLDFVEDDRIFYWAQNSRNTNDFEKKLIDSGFKCENMKDISLVQSTIAELIFECRNIFLERKIEKGVYQFSDLKRETLNLLKAKSEIREELQNRFKYIMVDEFQDTDEVQWEIIKILGTSNGGLNPAGDKIFVVGDDKQSIMRFRGADLSVFKKAKNELIEANQKSGSSKIPFIIKDYKPAPSEYKGLINIDQNFRSDGKLIKLYNDFFKFLFAEGIKEGFHTDHQKMLCLPQKVNNGSVEMHIFQNKEKENQQFEFIAAFAKKSWEKYPDRKTAILMKSRISLEALEKELRKADVPYIVNSGIGFFKAREISDMYYALSFLQNPHNDLAFTALMRSPMIGLSDREIWKIKKNAESHESLFDSFKKFIAHKSIILMLERWVKIKNQISLVEIIHIIYEESYFKLGISIEHGRDRINANINKLFKLAGEFEMIDSSIDSFINFIDGQIESDEKEGESPVHNEKEAPVQLFTIHGAKGLEFDNVILADALRQDRPDREPYLAKMEYGNWEWVVKAIEEDTKNEGKINPYYKAVKDKNSNENQAELKRLLYVAATRAKHNLIIVGLKKIRGNKFQKWFYEYFDIKNNFEENIPDEKIINGVKIVLHDNDTGFLKEESAENTLPKWDEIQELIRNNDNAKNIKPINIMQSITLKPSDKDDSEKIIHDLNLEFQKKYIPFERKISSLVFPDTAGIERLIGLKKGDMIHKALEIGIKDFNNIRSILSKTTNGIISDNTLDKMVNHIIEHLQQVYTSPTWMEIENSMEKYPEIPFSLNIGDQVVNGTIDMLTKQHNGWHIYDWKSDEIDSKDDLDRMMIENGYENQLKAYFKIVQELTGQRPVSANIVFTAWGVCKMEPLLN